MALLIVWAKRDNDNPDPEVDAGKFKPGMVVDILEDGQSPGSAVEASPWWRVIKVPGKASFYAYLLEADPIPDDPAARRTLLQFPRKRVAALDLDAIEQAAGFVTPGERPTETINLGGKVAVDARLSVVAKLDNPLVFAPLEDNP